MAFTADAIAILRRHWAHWPSGRQKRWEQWLQYRSTGPNDSRCPPSGAVSVINYVRHYDYAERLACGLLGREPSLEQMSFWSAAVVKLLIEQMHREGYSPATVRTWLIAIERILCAMDQDSDRHAINRAIRKTPRSGNVRGALSRMKDTREILALGQKLMLEAETSNMTIVAAAVLFRVGFMICLLALRPYRRGVFASLEYHPKQADAQRCVGNYLAFNNNTYWIVCRNNGVSRANAKLRSRRGHYGVRRTLSGGKFAPLREEVPAELVPYLKKYLEQHRSVLLGGRASCTALWVSTRGSQLSSIMIFKNVVAATLREFEVSICPQLFRNCYASSDLRRSKTRATRAHHVLGHLRSMTYHRYLWSDVKFTVAVGHEVDAIFDNLMSDE